MWITKKNELKRGSGLQDENKVKRDIELKSKTFKEEEHNTHS